MKEKNLKMNFIYNMLYQILLVLTPIITVPYTSRVLGADGIGIASYTNSIVQYFIIFGTLGISLYGNRQIAYVRNNKKKLAKTFWSIMSLNFITAGTVLVLYICIFLNVHMYSKYFLLQGINLAIALIDVSWLFMGLEEFKIVLVRNSIVRILGVVLIFVFVRNINDIGYYIAINAIISLCAALSMWPHVFSKIGLCKVDIKDVIKHIKPAIALFIPQIAMQIYTVLDKTMLGSITSVYEVGLYQQSQKVIGLTFGIVTALGVVMLPRMSNIYAKGNTKELKKYLNRSLEFIIYISIPMICGMIAISNKLVTWFLGQQFIEVKTLLVITAPVILFVGISNVLGIQYLMPTNQVRKYTWSICIGTCINAILNIFLIPKIGARGACIATVFSQMSMVIIQYIFLRKKILIRGLIIRFFKYLIIGIIMMGGIYWIGLYMKDNIISTGVQIIVGGLVYVVMLLLIRDEFTKKLMDELILKIKKYYLKR